MYHQSYPFPNEIPFLEFERRKVNDIINYFNNQPIPCFCEAHKFSCKTYDFCRTAKVSFKGHFLIYEKIELVIRNILEVTSEVSLWRLKDLIEGVGPMLTANSNFLILEILHFLKGFLIEYVEHDPNEAIKDYCKCLVFLNQSLMINSNTIVTDELQDLEYIILNFKVECDPEKLIFGDNFDLIKETFEKVKPSSIPKEQAKLENVLGRCLIAQKQFTSARYILEKSFHSSSMEPCDMRPFFFYNMVDSSYCLVKENQFQAASKAIKHWKDMFKQKYAKDYSFSMARSLTILSQQHLELNEFKDAIETAEQAIKTEVKMMGKKSKHSTIYAMQNHATLLLCGFKSKNLRAINQDMKLLMNQLHCHCTFNALLKTMMFQSSVPKLLNILSRKQSQYVEVKKRCKKCSRFKCRHYKNENGESKPWLNQIKTWRAFKNSALIGYFARNFN